MRGNGSVVAIIAVLGVVGAGQLPATWSPIGDAITPVGVARAAEDPEAVRKKFEVFVSDWMEKLRERERFNVTKIKWRPVGGGVEGVYIGYDTANYRILPISNAETMPIGKIVYLELKLRLSGESEDAARSQQPEIVERVEVTELFRYDSGKWVY